MGVDGMRIKKNRLRMAIPSVFIPIQSPEMIPSISIPLQPWLRGYKTFLGKNQGFYLDELIRRSGHELPKQYPFPNGTPSRKRSLSR